VLYLTREERNLIDSAHLALATGYTGPNNHPWVVACSRITDSSRKLHLGVRCGSSLRWQGITADGVPGTGQTLAIACPIV
jgi:hypothetical protein